MAKTNNLFLDYMNNILELAHEDDKIILIDCDLGKSFKSEIFKNEFPERSFNVGIAEQNAFSIAAGLASVGFKPIVQTFSIFASTRALDQFRNSICYTNQSVIIVGAKASLSDPTAGATHQAIDDVGILMSIPNLEIYSPASAENLLSIMKYLIDKSVPSYIRVENIITNKLSEKVINNDTSMEYFKLVNSICSTIIITTGSFTNISINVMRNLKLNFNINIAVINLIQLKPLDEELLFYYCKDAKNVIVYEPLNTSNGIGNKISSMIVKKAGWIVNFVNMGIQDTFTESGNLDDLLCFYHLDEKSLVDKILSLEGGN